MVFAENGSKMIFHLHTLSERINEIGSAKLKLWCLTSYANLRYIHRTLCSIFRQSLLEFYWANFNDLVIFWTLKEALSDGIFNSTYSNFSFSAKDHGLYYTENGSKMIFYLNTTSERARFKLSQNHKINEIGSPELKLWCVTNYANWRYIASVATVITWVIWSQFQRLYDFLIA